MSTSTTHPTRAQIQPLLDEFVQAMRRLYGRRLSRIILFGSFARGEAHAESDVDLLVLLHEEAVDVFAEQDRMRPEVMALTLKHERLVSAFPGTETGFVQRSKLIYYAIAEDGRTLFPMQEHIPALIKRSDETISDAQLLFDAGQGYASVISRAYYAIFYLAEALLISEGISVKSHRGLLNQLGKYFIKPEKIPAKCNEVFQRAFDRRMVSDYEFEPDITRETAQEVLEDASYFRTVGKTYLVANGFLADS